MDLNAFQKRVHSQFGQDGVIEQIFKSVGTTNRYFVEFGSSGNDTGLGNTSYLRKSGFGGLLMDGYDRPYGEDVHDRKYDVKIEFVKPSNIEALLKKYSVPEEFDFLSIDIDGQDFHVWNRIIDYSPRVVSIEMNYHIAPGLDRVMRLDDNYTWDGSEWTGASVTALKRLGNRKGYDLVCTCMSDAIFVRNDLTSDPVGRPLFRNMNDEKELVRLNTDIREQNALSNYAYNHFDRAFFSRSTDYL